MPNASPAAVDTAVHPARTGAAIVWACLRAEGVDTVFGYPGGAVIPLYDALEGSGIRHILTRHEQGAAFAAEGYARSTGRCGVAIATSGPGATNLLTGIADAKMDSVPLVCITGQVRTSLIGTDAFQEIDIFGATLPMVKWGRLVRSIQELPDVLRQAFHVAQSGRPGPVLIDIPVDVLKASAELPVPGQYQPVRTAHDIGTPAFPAEQLAALLGSARKPVVLVGAGVKLAGAQLELRRLLDRLDLPACSTVHGLGCISSEAPYYLGMCGMHGTRTANTVLHETDLLLVLGARLDDRVTGDPTRFAPDARIVHFEVDPSQLERVRAGALAVMGNLADTLPQFAAALPKLPRPECKPWRDAVCAAAREELGSDGGGTALPAIRFLDELFAMMPAEGVVVADVGQHQMWAAQRYRANNPRGFITSGGLGAMGFALPAALGVQLARPEACVVCISGDGGFQMNIQELATIKRFNLPVKILIVDNKFLGMVRQWQQLFYDRNYAETDLSDNPDFVAIGAAYGIESERLAVDPATATGLPTRTGSVLRRFLDATTPQLLVFECPPEANVFPMVPSGAALSEMLLEEA